MTEVYSQIDQTHPCKLRIEGLPFGRTPWALTAARQMTIKPLPRVCVYFPEGLAWISTPKIVSPATQMLIKLFDQLRDRFIAGIGL
jgi:hypothetical protein